MRLVSDHIVEGREGPTFGQVYPTLLDVDLSDIYAFTKGQPWADYARMRAEAPVMWHPMPRSGVGFWAVTRFEDVKRVNGDPETFSSEKGGILMALGPEETRHPTLFSASTNSMINLDALPHRQLRKEHMPYFTATYIRGLRERVAGEVTRLLDAMAPLGTCDMVEKFSQRLPIFTLCEMLGVPEADRERFMGWIHFLEMAQQVAMEQIDQLDGLSEPSPQIAAFIELFNTNVADMFDYGRHMLAKRRADPQPDLMSAIANATVDGEHLPDPYLDGAWLLIVFAGNDTTRNSLSGAMKLFTENPEQKARLQADGSLLSNAVHEITRMVSPVIYMRRTATRDTEIGGQRIAEGEKVIMYYGAANRDDAMFADADRFDITRANAEKNIAFGYGPHICIGRMTAQLQLEEAYRQIFARFPDIRWTGEMDIAPNNFVHAVRRLEVAFTPA
ncbi:MULTISPECIES: cytochrome P450 [unclassified Sphingomonas]|uniref:cytochrome P450 n=1 Tax=unclassified Sphingomonas TaxID=196159 RepID=UPI00092765B7|nr:MULTISPECIES: cytochrome P450 [unclassified Sphingomonas]OJU16777.1 MAG: cytochrome [Sphingomonas sp. 66-10]